MDNIRAAEILEKAIRCMKSDRAACPEYCNDCVHNATTAEGIEALAIAIRTLRRTGEQDARLT